MSLSIQKAVRVLVGATFFFVATAVRAQTVATFKVEKVPAGRLAGWSSVLEENDKLLAAWRTASHGLRARLTKAQRSGPPKQVLALKLAAKGTEPPSSGLIGIRVEIEALRSSVRSQIQAGLENTANGAPAKLGDAIPGCDVRNVDWSNFEYAFESKPLGSRTYPVRASAAALLPALPAELAPSAITALLELRLPQ